MKPINKEFNVPYYIFEEIVEYVELSAQGHCKSAKWNNIKALLRLAQVNNHLTEQQVNHIIKTYCRE